MQFILREVAMVGNTLYVLDTTALIYYKHFQGENVTTNSVLCEVKDQYEEMIVGALVSGGVIKILSPPDEYIKRASDIAQKTGDLPVLSDTDIDIIALALHLRDKGKEVVVVTDDYAIQNILKRLGIKYYSLTRKIRYVAKWKLVCSKCGKEYPISAGKKIKECIICGGEIIRKRIH